MFKTLANACMSNFVEAIKIGYEKELLRISIVDELEEIKE